MLVAVVILSRDNILVQFTQSICGRDISNWCDKRHEWIQVGWNVNRWCWHYWRKISLDAAEVNKKKIKQRREKKLRSIKINGKQLRKLYDLLFRTVAAYCRCYQVFAWDIIQYCTFVASLIFVLFTWRSFLYSFAVLLVLSISSFQFKYLIVAILIDFNYLQMYHKTF